MGKQSARMYFWQKDHSDLYFADEYEFFHNHSKIYKGKNLLWEREKPRFVFAGGYGFMATSEDLKTFSSFPFPQSNIVQLEKYKNEPVTETSGLTYAFGKYFMAQRISKRTYETNKWEIVGCYLLYSENGYEWKTLKKSNEYISRLEKINKNSQNEKITFSMGGETFQFGSDLKIEKIFEYDVNVLASGNGIAFFSSYGNLYILKKSEIEKVPTSSNSTSIRYNQNDGYFYFFMYSSISFISNENIVLNKTKDGVSFEYLGEINGKDISGLPNAAGLTIKNVFFINSSIYILVGFDKTLNADQTVSMIKWESNRYSIREIGTYTKNLSLIFNYCIGNFLYFIKKDYEGDDKEIEKNVKYCRIPIEEAYVCETFDKLVQSSEELKFTDKIYNWYYDYTNHPSLGYAVCTDKNVIIQS